MRLLVAEDEKDMNRLITRALEKEGYGVDSCFDGEEAMDYLESAEYDGIILDIMMPKMDGHQVLKKLRARGSNLPVLFLTARDSIADRVAGLDLGADDYLIKPFDFDELLARVRAMMRKRSGHKTSGDRSIELSSREYSILEYMAMHPGQVLSREQIETHVWNFDYSGGSNVVDVYISYLRKKIDGKENVKLIRTVWGTGWMIKEGE